jgi:general secretion pathway protein G
MWRKAGLIWLILGALAILVAAVLIPCMPGDNAGKMRERVLRQDVLEFRALIAQYTLDLHKRPQSIDDLVNAGYLKHLPTDPMTGRRDTWVAEWSKDPKLPGIESIRSVAEHR